MVTNGFVLNRLKEKKMFLLNQYFAFACSHAGRHGNLRSLF
jgi:hypothetical protein